MTLEATSADATHRPLPLMAEAVGRVPDLDVNFVMDDYAADKTKPTRNWLARHPIPGPFPAPTGPRGQLSGGGRRPTSFGDTD